MLRAACRACRSSAAGSPASSSVLPSRSRHLHHSTARHSGNGHSATTAGAATSTEAGVRIDAASPSGSASSQPGPSATHRHTTFSSASSPSSSQDNEATHFGFQTIPSSEKETLVGGVFSSVASSYDVMNDAMSLGIHRLWKDHFVSNVLDPRGGIKVLDVAGGTGDIALRILDHARNKYGDRDLSVKVLDINEKMLKEGMKRMRKTMYWGTSQVDFALGNAESLHTSMQPTASTITPRLSATTGASRLPPLKSEPIPDNSLDLYTIAFGIRNCTHIDEVLKEAHRVLKPGGVFACLEFGKVGVPLLAELYRLYSFTFIPSLGHILAGDRDSYQYLIESIERFPTQAQFARMIQAAGFALPGSDTAHQLGWSHFPTTSSGSVVDSLAGVGLGIASRLPGLGSVIAQQQEMMERQKRENLDVLGTWEDLTFGIASIWTGIKPVDAGVGQ